MSKSRDQLVKYLNQIDITDKVVLDAGCGPKEKWARNFTKGDPKEYVTLDDGREFEPDVQQDLNSKIIKFEVTQDNMFLIKFEDSQLWREDFFDIIFCIELLEHLWNPIECLRTLERVIKPNGKLYLSTPLINPYHDEVDYARYTSEWYEKVLTEVGFKDIKIKPRVATDGLPYLLQFYKAEGLRMSKTRLAKGQQNKMIEIGYFVEATK